MVVKDVVFTNDVNVFRKKNHSKFDDDDDDDKEMKIIHESSKVENDYLFLGKLLSHHL